MTNVRIEWHMDAFRAIRHSAAPLVSQMGEVVAEKANRAAEGHDTGHGPAGRYDSKDYGGPQRPRTYVRTADARGDLDEALHGTLTEALHAAKGKTL